MDRTGGASEGGHSPFPLTHPGAAARADQLIVWYMMYKKAAQSERLHYTRRPRYMVYDPPAASDYFSAEARKVQAAVNEFLRTLTAMPEMNYVRFAQENLGLASLAVVAVPPDITWGREPVIRPWTWITLTFYPTPLGKSRVHRPLVARFFASVLHNRYMQHRAYLAKRPALKALFEAKAQAYTERGYREARARKLAWRDVHRVILGCTWLIATIDALQYRLIKPDDIIPPRPVMRSREPINPGDIDPHYTQYTWQRLRDLLGQ